MKKLIFIFIAAAIICMFSCSRKNYEPLTKIDDLSFHETNESTNYIKIEMTNGSGIIIELYPDTAPITVANFKKLVSQHFYDGLIFHRVIKDFMIQTGDPTGTGYSGSDEKIAGEFSDNGIQNDLKHERGVVSMARTGNDNNSASSQFFICQTSYAYGDGKYAAFGRVIAGIDTVDNIASVTVDSNKKPTKEQKIKTIRFVDLDTEETQSGTN